MLKTLGIDLTNADVRAERNVARYVIFAATVVNKSLPGGQEGPVLEALFQLGQTITPWMNGSTASHAVNNGRRRDGRRDADPYPVGRAEEHAGSRD